MFANSASVGQTSQPTLPARPAVLPAQAASAAMAEGDVVAARTRVHKYVLPPSAADRLSRVGPAPTFEISPIEAVRLAPELYAISTRPEPSAPEAPVVLAPTAAGPEADPVAGADPQPAQAAPETAPARAPSPLPDPVVAYQATAPAPDAGNRAAVDRRL